MLLSISKIKKKNNHFQPEHNTAGGQEPDGLSHRVRELDCVTVDLLSQTIILHWMAGKNSGLDRAVFELVESHIMKGYVGFYQLKRGCQRGSVKRQKTDKVESV